MIGSKNDCGQPIEPKQCSKGIVVQKYTGINMY